MMFSYGSILRLAAFYYIKYLTLTNTIIQFIIFLYGSIFMVIFAVSLSERVARWGFPRAFRSRRITQKEHKKTGIVPPVR